MGGAASAQSHAARPDDPPFRKESWTKANPSMAHMPDLEAAIRKEAVQARRDPALLATFEALRLNLGTADTEVSVLLAPGVPVAKVSSNDLDPYQPKPGDRLGN